ncbi:MAG: hypothetical protein QOE24_2931 [Frankiales bacterium]|nr:hypothetical protein [Frankiales bacterium]
MVRYQLLLDEPATGGLGIVNTTGSEGSHLIGCRVGNSLRMPYQQECPGHGLTLAVAVNAGDA